MRYFIELAYNGQAYHGWQIQPNATSVQAVLHKAFFTLFKKEIELVGAGRTDTGVHARFYVAHFDSDLSIDIQQLLFKLNRILPADIVIFSIYEVPVEIHARFSAISRKYEYHIITRKDPFLNPLAWFVPHQLNMDAMNEAAAVLLQYTDFTSFAKLHSDAKTNLCKVSSAFWEQKNHLLIFHIEADRFLRNMVRAIVGTLVEIGKGKLTVDDMHRIISEKNRCAAGQSVPAQGLYLVDVKYPIF